MLTDPGVAVGASVASEVGSLTVSWTTAVGGRRIRSGDSWLKGRMLPGPGVTVATKSQLTAVKSTVTVC